MRPSTVTAVASIVTRPAPDISSWPQWTRCQSVAQPSTAEYWHIGDTTMRFGSVSSRSVSGSNRPVRPATCDESVGGNGGFAQARRFAEHLDLVGRFPREFRFVPAEVAVRRRLAIDRSQQIEHPDDALGPEVEVRIDELDDARVRNPAGTLRVHGHVDRLRDADRVRQLHLALLGQARRDDILRDIARRIRCRAVDFRRVLARECAATVRCRAAVRVDDDLAAGDARVTVRAADLEAPGRVDHEARAGQHVLRKYRLDDLLDHRLGELFLTL